MFTCHYLNPEQMWGVFKDGVFVAIFGTSIEAQAYCDRHNAK